MVLEGDVGLADDLVGNEDTGGRFAFEPLLEALQWPLASWALLAPQRRPPDPDGNRPL